MSTVRIKYDPLPAFRPLHVCTAEQAALIGGYGSGKTRALVGQALKLGLQQPGSNILICRRTIGSLADTTESDFLDQLPDELLEACHKQRAQGHTRNLILPNGTKYFFRGLDDWRKIKSTNFAGIYIDEADEIDEDTYTGLHSRLRQVQPRGGVEDFIRYREMRLACNPAGHNWIWRRFVHNKDAPCFISTTLDNPYNPISYVEGLLSYPEPWVRRYVFCSFDDFEGTIYPEWDWGTHVVKPYGAYDKASWFWMGMDPGTAHPTAGIWCYYDRDRHALVGVAEYAEHGIASDHHVEAWRGIEAHGTHNLSRWPGRMNVTRRIADPTIATRDRGSMTALEDQYRRHGFHFEHGPRMIPDRMPMLGQLIRQRRFLITEELERTYQQLKEYRYEDLTPVQRDKGSEPKPLKKDVDLVDAAQYIASRYIPDPVKVAPTPKVQPETPGETFTYGNEEALAASGKPQYDPWREQAEDIAKEIAGRVRRPATPQVTEAFRGL